MEEEKVELINLDFDLEMFSNPGKVLVNDCREQTNLMIKHRDNYHKCVEKLMETGILYNQTDLSNYEIRVHDKVNRDFIHYFTVLGKDTIHRFDMYVNRFKSGLEIVQNNPPETTQHKYYYKQCHIDIEEMDVCQRKMFRLNFLMEEVILKYG